MKIRIINTDQVSPIYSQAIYHGLAEQMQADDNPILVITRPDSPYISIGMHQQLAGEIDQDFCQQNDIPVIRRQVGGGTVLLDANQLFFQFVFPKSKVPNQAAKLYPFLLNPVLQTYHHFGIPAVLKSLNDIQVCGKKIGGTGAASINNATVLVGSFMYEFDYHLMSQCVKSASENFKFSLQNLLQENITGINSVLQKPPSMDDLTTVFLDKIAQLLPCEIKLDKLSLAEKKAIALAQQELSDDDWLHGEDRKLLENGIKISSGIYLLETSKDIYGNKITIRIQYKNQYINSIWLESNNTVVQASLILIATEINRLRPKTLESQLIGIIEKASTTFCNEEIRLLAKNITELATIREY